jgi:uncharacterized protein YbjT (DUF2867 family)
MILVTGAGGTVGSEVVRQLKGVPFRAAFHSQAKADAARANGIGAVLIDYERPETLDAAFAGVEKLFLLSSSNTQQELAAVDAAKRAGVKHIIKLSVIGAGSEDYSFAHVHRPVEEAIEASGIAWTHLRPNGFMDNMHNFMRGTAAVAVKALTEAGHESKAYTITGPEALTYGEIATKIGAASGREVSYVPVADADMKSALVGQGAPEAYADAFVDLQRFYRGGVASRVSNDVKNVTGREPITFDEYANEHWR